LYNLALIACLIAKQLGSIIDLALTTQNLCSCCTIHVAAWLAPGCSDASLIRKQLRHPHVLRIGCLRARIKSHASESRPVTCDPSHVSDRVRPPETQSHLGCALASCPPCSSPHLGAIPDALYLGHAPSPVLTSHLLCNISPTIATYALYSYNILV
jgi:hypothetical protein